MFGNLLQAQTDSLSKKHQDSLQMELLREEGFNNNQWTTQERRAAFEKAEALAIKYAYKKRQFFILGDAGDYYTSIDRLEEAIICYKKAIQLKEQNDLAIRRHIYA